jgi:hypothetical protein
MMTGYSGVMATTAALRAADLFKPHPNLSDEANRNIVQSEIEGGVFLDELSEGSVLEVETQNHRYTIIIRSRGEELIWGHSRYCPGPVPVRIAGSTWGGSMLKLRFIGRGMYLEFHHPTYPRIVTSRVLELGLGAARDQSPSADKLIAHAFKTCRTHRILHHKRINP